MGKYFGLARARGFMHAVYLVHGGVNKPIVSWYFIRHSYSGKWRCELQCYLSHHVLGSFFQNMGLPHSWGDRPAEKEYYDENLAAINRGVDITRVFILQRAKTVREDDGSIIDQAIVNVMETQSTIGIFVYITWVEDLLAAGVSNELLLDFVIWGD